MRIEVYWPTPLSTHITFSYHPTSAVPSYGSQCAPRTALLEEGAPPHVMSAILLIEDDASVQQAISRPLERAGHRVMVLAEPLLALDLLEHANIHFDLIIADVASFRYAHHQHALGLLYHRASAVDSQVLACTTRGDLRSSNRYSNLPNPLLTTRFLRLVGALVAPDSPPTDQPTEPLDEAVLPETYTRFDSSK